MMQNTAKNLCHWISGDEPLLVHEAREQLILEAKKKGFTEKNIVFYDADFDATMFAALIQNQSLFSEKKIIDLRNASGKFNVETQKLLKTISEDIFLIISSNALTPAQLKSELLLWVKQHGKHSVIRPISRTQLPQWIKKRAEALSLTLSSEAITLLTTFTEGNLLATHQILQKLQLHYASQTVTELALKNLLGDHSQFSVFDLADALAQRHIKRALRIVKKLRECDEEPILALWGVCRALRTMNAYALLKKAAEIDEMIKGAIPGDPWLGLSQLCLTACLQTRLR